MKKTPRAKTQPLTHTRVDAISLLKADHTHVAELLEQYEKAKTHPSDESFQLAQRICEELQVHAKVEEEIFYPEVRAAIDSEDLMDEAQVEHESLEQLIHEIKTMAPDNKLFDAKIKVLGEYVKHHVREEQTEMFPKARKAGLDLKALGEKIRLRKEELAPGMADDKASVPSTLPKSSGITGHRRAA